MSDYITTTNKLKITELDFDAIKNALKTYLQGQEEFKDYNFDGSAMNILLDVLAYNTHYNGFYTNMLASEMFMDSATLRSSIVSLAKHLGYTPASKKGSSVNLDVVFEGSGSALTIPKYAKFTTKIGSDVYTFLTTEAYVASFDSSDRKYKARNIGVKEGVSFTTTYSVKGTTNELFEIPNEDVDASTIEVAVGGEVYTKADDITEITSTNKVFFLQEGTQNKYEIYFGDGVIGKKPSTGETVQIIYNASMIGSDGNGATKFTLAESIIGATSATVSLSSGYTRSSGGAERESTSSIRVQAPRQYGLQKRVVTKNDYKTRLENDFNLVDSVRVWGGEENIPPEYGRVYISIKPKTGYVLSRSERNRIADDILKTRNVVTVRPKFVDPDYLFVIPDVTISYDKRKTTRSQDQLKTLVRNTILNYSASDLSKFDQYFRYSMLSRKIDDTEVSIMNNNTKIAIKKRIRPIDGVEGHHRIHFDNPLHRPHSGHMHILQSTTFNYRGNPNCTIVDRDGVLMIATLNQRQGLNNLATVDYINYETDVVNSNVGWIDYETGELYVKFTALSITDGSNYVYFAAKPRIEDIIPKQNSIITIDSSDITVNCIEDSDRVVEDKVRGY